MHLLIYVRLPSYYLIEAYAENSEAEANAMHLSGRRNTVAGQMGRTCPALIEETAGRHRHSRHRHSRGGSGQRVPPSLGEARDQQHVGFRL